MYHDLRSFIKMLEKENLLKTIEAEISPILEMTEISRRMLSKGGPALLFTNTGKMPVLTNLFASTERIAMAMNIKPSEFRKLGEMLAFLRSPEAPADLKELFSMWPLLKKVLSMKPKEVKSAAIHENVYLGDDIDINMFPIQKCWPEDASPLITWPLIVTKGKNYNLGIYRLQVLAKDKLIVRWLKHRGGAEHHRDSLRNHQAKMPIAAVIGADPALILAATMPVPGNISEYDFSGLLRGAKLELVKCKTQDLLVPANAEIVIEGEIDLNEYHPEGPYGDHTGYYNDIEEFPVFNITAITTRNNPIYLSTYTGKPPDEPSILGEALNELFIPIIQKQWPEIIDFYLPPEGCSYRVAVISIKKSFPGHAKQIMFGIWSYLKQFLYTKFVIIVDADINVRDWKEVIWAISTRMDPARDITIIENTPIDYLDFASPESGLGGKVGFDATNKIYPETKRNWGKIIEMDQDIIDKVKEKWNSLGLGDY